MLTFLGISPEHLIILAIALLLLFGGRKIPELMRGLGSGIKEFKDAVKDEDKKPAESQNNNSSNTPN